MIRRLSAALIALLILCSGAAVIAQETEGKIGVPDAAQFVGPPKGQPLTGEMLTQETHRIGGKLRCPVCQGLSVADSPAPMAVNMKEQTRELLARGYTEEQILAYFERSYGQFVLLEPKFEGMNRLVWLLPVIALAIGGFVVFLKMRNLGKESAPAAAAQAETPAETPATPAATTEDPYLARVRDLVGGGK